MVEQRVEWWDFRKDYWKDWKLAYKLVYWKDHWMVDYLVSVTGMKLIDKMDPLMAECSE